MRAALLMMLIACAPLPAATHAQTVRISGSTHVRYLELRPLITDSIDATAVPGDGLLRQTSDGRVVRCVPGEAVCRDVRAGERVSTVPVVHDVEVSAWGFGRGASALVQLRGRSAFGGSELWPRADDAFDVLAAYAELARERVRFRVGRQWKVSGLGFYNFDGVAVEARPFTTATIEAYGGRSLVRGLNEPRTGGALESIEALAPAAAGVLLGIHARYQPTRNFALGSVYQVDFRDDGRGLFSELFAADAFLRVRNVAIEGALEIDVASAATNEARIRVRPPPFGRFAIHAEARRYRPYFELWTIWGAFSPVGFDEALAGITWAESRGRVIVQADARVRSYASDPLEDPSGLNHEGWGTGINVAWRPAAQWRFDASYRVESGFGAARREGHGGAFRGFGDVASISVHAIAFQRLYEFRLEEGTVLGVGTEASLRLSERAQLFAGATRYRHLQNGAVVSSDWNQWRGSLRAQWTVGAEPTASARRQP